MTESFTGTWTALVASLRALPVAARVWIVVGTAALVVALAMLAPPELQDEGYHDFAPTALFGWRDFGIVASNGAFLLVGVWGLWRICFRRRAPWPFGGPGEDWPYLVFFLGVVLIALGSGYYHAGPTTATLLWDRLAMTVVFMALLAAFIADRIHLGAGVAVALPLLLALGVLSMAAWQVTDDLRLYRIVQALPILLIWIICLLFPGRVTRVKYAAWMAFWFGLATFCDLFDDTVYGWIGFGGHAIKHVLAAIACVTILAMIQDAGRRLNARP
ncbi:MAG: hypothetical protein V3U23_03630 [Kiloniellales bacterium]